MYFSDGNDEVVYILVSINIHVVQEMDSGHYYCDVLNYSTITMWRCYDDRIPNYTGYVENSHDELPQENEQNQ